MLTLELTTYLGPAAVLDAGAGRIKLELPDEHAWAISAIPFAYQPVVGDVVLAAGRAGDWYVIGVLKASGPTTFLAPGDLTIAAPRGRVSIDAAHGIEMRSPEVRVKAQRLEVIAKRVVERFHEAKRWVRETFHLSAGSMRTRVDGKYDVRAESIRALAEKDVKIDGTKINLG